MSTPPGFWADSGEFGQLFPEKEVHMKPPAINPPEQPAPLSAKEQRAPTQLVAGVDRRAIDTAPMFQGEPLEAVEALMKMTRKLDETYREIIAGEKTIHALRPVLDATIGVRLFLERMIGPMVHRLKCDPEPFAKVVAGAKRYEVRKFDRDFKVGDRLELLEFDRETKQYSGQRVRAKITYITGPGAYGLPDDVGVLGIEVLDE